MGGGFVFGGGVGGEVGVVRCPGLGLRGCARERGSGWWSGWGFESTLDGHVCVADGGDALVDSGEHVGPLGDVGHHGGEGNGGCEFGGVEVEAGPQALGRID